MTARLLEGAPAAARILEEARLRVRRITEQTVQTPCLATVLVGDDPSSHTYIRMKRNRCAKIAIRSEHLELPASTTTAELVATIDALGRRADVHGILLQHPAPAHIDERAAFEAIPVEKDVDGVTYGSFARMWFGEATDGRAFPSCTPEGILRLLDAYGISIAGAHAVVIGRSPILGKPVAGLLLHRNATVTICHSRTLGLADVVRTADIVVAAVGRARFVRGDWLKPGAVVVDAGYNAGNVGDVDFEGCANVASAITPVPGGVGPMTLAVLMDQTAIAASRQLGVD